MASSMSMTGIGADGTGSANSSPQAHQESARPPVRSSANVTVYQTTGPDAYTSPIQAAGGSGAPALNPRSCVTCRRRKVRCDKQMPCSNCRRALIPCVFPAPGRAPRQPRPKDPNAPPKTTSQREVELVKRLKKLEGIVEELSGQIEVESGARGMSEGGDSPDAPSHGTAAKHSSSTGHGPSPKSDSVSEQGSEGVRRRDVQQQLGRLVLNDHKGNTRYVSNGFWSKLNDELDFLREETSKLTDEESEESEIEDTPNDTPSVTGGTINDHHAFILGYRSADVDLRVCHPPPSQVPFLWTAYQDNVEPLLKVLHVPTTEALIRDARKNPERLSPAAEALVFAIYYSAVISLEPDEVEDHLGTTQLELLHRYRFALEQSLSRANFLNSSELMVVQAFVLFLVTVRRVDDSRFCWSLTVLVIRIAQGMGLHRDGTQFDLTPFETEMRRRVWWALLNLDLRSAEEVGTDLVVSDTAYDTRMPLNINDDDISPSSTAFPEPHEGRSDSAVAIVRYEILNLSRRFMSESTRKTEINITDREEVLKDVYRRVEQKFLKHVVDESDPLYWVVAMIARIIMAKMCLFTYQTQMFPGADSALSEDIRQRIYVASLEIVELGHKLNSDPRCKQYRWLFMTYTNWHAIAFALIETCRRPWTALVERAWQAVIGFDRDPVELAKTSDHAAIFLPLRKLFVRARRHRAAEIARLSANIDEARRLDFQERMNPAEARFGPVRGVENTMEQWREKWWNLIRPGGPALPFWGSRGASDTPGGSLETPGMQSEGHTEDSYREPMAVPSSEMQVSTEAMEYMTDMLSQPNVSMSMLLPLNNFVSQEQRKNFTSSLPGGMSPSTNLQDSVHNTNSLGQQAIALEQHVGDYKDDNLPPYLWAGAYGAEVPRRDDGLGDMDMIEHDFNWQDWTNSLQNLGMDPQRPPQGP